MSEENQEVIEQEEVTDVHDGQPTVSQEQYDSLVAELEEVKGKLPVDKSEQEIAIEAKEQELFEKEVNLTLKENGLEQFADVIKVSDSNELTKAIESLTGIVNDIKLNMGYVPADVQRENITAYDQAKQQGNTKGMIKTLFGLK